MRHDCKEQNLRRRVKCEQCRILHLKRVITEPNTYDREIKRRQSCIIELQASIRLHEEALTRIQKEIQDAPDLLSQAEARLRGLKREQNAHLITKFIAEYLTLHESLKELRSVDLIEIS